MPDRAVLLQELLELLHTRANYLSIPELRGRTRQGQPADLTVRANVALACGLDVDMHHGSPCVVTDRQAFNAAREAGERMQPGAWDGVGHYFTSITDIERHLLPANVVFGVDRAPVKLTEDGPVDTWEGDETMMGGSAAVDGMMSFISVSPARALLHATLIYQARELGVDVPEV
jgi:hypothetical protein